MAWTPEIRRIMKVVVPSVIISSLIVLSGCDRTTKTVDATATTLPPPGQPTLTVPATEVPTAVPTATSTPRPTTEVQVGGGAGGVAATETITATMTHLTPKEVDETVKTVPMPNITAEQRNKLGMPKTDFQWVVDKNGKRDVKASIDKYVATEKDGSRTFCYGFGCVTTDKSLIDTPSFIKYHSGGWFLVPRSTVDLALEKHNTMFAMVHANNLGMTLPEFNTALSTGQDLSYDLKRADGSVIGRVNGRLPIQYHEHDAATAKDLKKDLKCEPNCLEIRWVYGAKLLISTDQNQQLRLDMQEPVRSNYLYNSGSGKIPFALDIASIQDFRFTTNDMLAEFVKMGEQKYASLILGTRIQDINNPFSDNWTNHYLSEKITDPAGFNDTREWYNPYIFYNPTEPTAVAK